MCRVVKELDVKAVFALPNLYNIGDSSIPLTKLFWRECLSWSYTIITSGFEFSIKPAVACAAKSDGVI
jgi:hypothetical protein